MAFFRIIREQDEQIELRIEFDSRKEASLLYYELIESKTEWSQAAKTFLLAMRSAAERPKLH